MTAGLEELQHRFQATLQSRVPVHIDRLRWDKERIAAHQRKQLRHLLAHAIEHSPFHSRRLAGVNPDTFEIEQLRSLPVMTKEEMMAAFDDIVTDRRLTRERVEAHVAATGEFPTLLDGKYFALASGGSSGLKGMFVYDEDSMVDYVARITASSGLLKNGRRFFAAVASPSATHAGRLGFSLVDGEMTHVIHAPVTLPLHEIVHRLNEGQPDAVFAYPSVLYRLAGEQRSGRLSIRPARIIVGAEQLWREAETYISDAFGVPVYNVFASSEGLFGGSPPGEQAFRLSTDLAIIELVDEENRPVPAGTPSARVLVTNLFNTVQPLIRYVLGDRFLRRPDASDHGHVVSTIEGRSYKTFVYQETAIHQLTLLSSVTKAQAIVDYQIRQTPRGVDIDLLVNGRLDEALLKADIEQALAHAGLRDPQVSIRIVGGFERDSCTGKLRRLVPLSGPGAGTVTAV